MQNLKLDSDDQATKLRDPSQDFNKSQKTGSSKLMKLEITLDDDFMPLPGQQTKAKASEIHGADAESQNISGAPLNQTIPETPLFSQFEERVSEKSWPVGKGFIAGVGFFVVSAFLLAFYAPFFRSNSSVNLNDFLSSGAVDSVLSDLPVASSGSPTVNEGSYKSSTNSDGSSLVGGSTSAQNPGALAQEPVSSEPSVSDLSQMLNSMTDSQLAEIQAKNPYWVLPNPKPGYLAGKMWSEEEQKIYHAGMQQRYVYQHFKAVQSLRYASRNGAEKFLLNSLSHEKFWIRMEAALALIEQGRSLSLLEQSQILKNQRSELVKNYLKRFTKTASESELYLTRSLIKFMDAPSRQLAIQIIYKHEKNAELKKVYLTAATLDPARNIREFAQTKSSSLQSDSNQSTSLIANVDQRKNLFAMFPDRVPSPENALKVSHLVTADIAPPNEIASAPTQVSSAVPKEEFDGFQEAVQFIRQAGEVIKSLDDGFDSLRATVRSDE